MQHGPYQHAVAFPDAGDLHRVVREFLAEGTLGHDPTHLHNFEVWLDEKTLLVNDVGLSCVLRIMNDPRYGGSSLAGLTIKDPT